MLAHHIVNGRIEEAENIVNSPIVRTIGANEVDDSFIEENVRILAEILRIKKSQGKKKTVTREHGGGKVVKLEQPYDRLVLCRDLTDGTLFQLFCKDERKALQLFLMKDCRWVGRTICIYEPDFEFTIAGMPALSTDQPLLPLHNECIPNKQSPFVTEWATSAYTKALYVQNADLRLVRVNVVEACGAAMCDGQHDVAERCCALTSGTPKKLLLRCTVSSIRAGIRKAQFQSAAWTALLMEEECTKVNSADLLDHIEVRRACQEVMTFYEDAGVRWTVCGWFKPGIAPGAEVAKEPKMHVTCIRPDLSIQGAPRYRCPAPPAVAEEVLHLNFPPAAGRAGRGNAREEVVGRAGADDRGAGRGGVGDRGAGRGGVGDRGAGRGGVGDRGAGRGGVGDRGAGRGGVGDRGAGRGGEDAFGEREGVYGVFAGRGGAGEGSAGMGMPVAGRSGVRAGETGSVRGGAGASEIVGSVIQGCAVSGMGIAGSSNESVGNARRSVAGAKNAGRGGASSAGKGGANVERGGVRAKVGHRSSDV